MQHLPSPKFRKLRVIPTFRQGKTNKDTYSIEMRDASHDVTLTCVTLKHTASTYVGDEVFPESKVIRGRKWAT